MQFRTALAAVAILTVTVSPAWCGGAPPPPPPPPVHVGPGPWVVGGVAISAFSLMFCAAWTCATTHHEMSPEEAVATAALPFACLWWGHPQNEHPGPVCSGPPKH